MAACVVDGGVQRIAAAVSHRFRRPADRAAGPPIYLAVLAMIGVMITTAIAAPIMLDIDTLSDDPVPLQDAFDMFTPWGVYARDIFFAIAFLATTWALTILARRPATPSHEQTGTS